MRKLKTSLVAFVVASSIFAAAGTAWARSDGLQRGTSWTDLGDTGTLIWGDPSGVSWEIGPAF
jgi:hypothetical protein